MRFYTQPHQYSCGIDLHARTMYVCVLDEAGEIVFHRNIRAEPEAFLRAIRDYRDGLVVAAECMFTWYWLADLCAEEGIEFVLGHALYMKAIHGAKAKNDRIDAEKIARLLRSGTLPEAYVYPRAMRPTRDLLRRRMKCVRRRAGLLTHIQHTQHQYQLTRTAKKIRYPGNRACILDGVTDPAVHLNLAADLEHVEFLDGLIKKLEVEIERLAKHHEPTMFMQLRTVPGIGKILGLTILYEVCDVRRFPRVQQFASYARLVRCQRESAGKKKGTSGARIGNGQLKWAFGEAALLLRQKSEAGRLVHERLQRKYGKNKALGVLTHRLGRTVYFMLRRGEAFDEKKFLNN